MSMPWYHAFVRLLFGIETAPDRLFTPEETSLNAMFDTSAEATPVSTGFKELSSPDLSIVPYVKVNPFVDVPSIPLRNVLWMFMLLKDGANVLVSEIPAPVVVFWMVPPDESPPWDVFPPPATVRPPLAPVLLSTIPFAPPVAEIFWKLRPLPPMLVLTTLSAGPAPGVVPPPVAEKFAAELSVTPPVKLIVAPVLPLRLMPVPVSEIAPVKLAVPPERPATETESPALVEIAAATSMFPLAAPLRTTPPPELPEMLVLDSYVSVVIPVPVTPAP